MASQIFIWWLAAQGFGLAGLPLARFLFRALPDRGYAFAKALGLLLVGYLAWLAAMLGLAPFGAPLIVASALVAGGVGLLLNKQQRTENKEQRPEPSPRFSILNFRFSIPTDWRLILAYEVLFAAALVFLALLRSYNPNPWGTERPMDFALFNAIRRSASFPPHDPWLSGYSINYYYFGYMLMAVVGLVSGLAPAVAFNLSLALIFALTALGVAGVIYNLIAVTENREPKTENPPTKDEGRKTNDYEMASSGGRWSVVGGRLVAIVLAVVLVLLAGNQGGALEVVTGAEMATALKGPQLAQAIANGLGPRQPLALDPPFKGWDFDGTRVISPTNMLEDFNWWWPSRAVWDDYRDPDNPSAQPTRRYTITEFPFFSFWLGDMHPHVMALPFCLLALALALQTAARPSAPPFAMGRRGWLELALTGIVLGSLYAINSWDFPTYLLLFLGALLLLHIRLGQAPTEPRIQNPEPALENKDLISEDIPRNTQQDSPVHPPTRSPFQGVWWRHYGGQAAMVALASVVMLAPFYLTFRSLVGGKEPLIDAPLLATITRTLGLVTSSRTAIYSFLLIFGLFLLPLVVYTLSQGRSTRATTNLTRWWPWIALAALAVGLPIGFPLLALLPLAIYAATLAVYRTNQPATAFALWAFALICLVCFGTEIVYIRDGFEGQSARMNTIFKFYYQAWLIWGVLAGYALWWLAAPRPTTEGRDEQRTENKEQNTESEDITNYGLRTTDRTPNTQHAPGFTHHASRITGAGLFGGLFVLLLAGALLYPWLTAGKSFRESQRIGLLGTTPREATPDGAAAINWLREQAPGNAVVLEAVGGSYSAEGFGGVSAASGLATVLGWPGHEDQWRGGDPAVRAQIGPRQEDVKTIYATPNADEARALLKKYKVDYIYIGQLERNTFSPESLAKFDQLGSPVFREGEVTIYLVAGQ
jgi:YYY domain-containing protein